MSLEQRVTATLKDAGSRIDTTSEPISQPLTALGSKRRRFRPMVAFAAGFAAVLLFGVVAVLVSGEVTNPADDAQPAYSRLLGSIVNTLPDSFDPIQAVPLFAQEGNPEEVAIQYLETRIPTIGAGVARVEEQEGFTLVQWAWGRLLDPDYRGGDDGFKGWLVLRPIPHGFEVVAATTDGVNLSGITLSDGAVKGVVNSESGQFIGADVLSLDGSPVDSAPHPGGLIPEAATLWGTAGASDPPLKLDVPVSEPVIFRVNQVGGTLLSISEIVLGSDAASSGAVQIPGRPISDRQFNEVFGDETSVDVIRETVFYAHARNQDQDPIGWFTLYGAKANTADGIQYDQPVNCIFQYGMDGAISGHQCGPKISSNTPGIAISRSCADPEVTMFSAWAINPEVELVELSFSDGSHEQLEPTRGYLIWAWRNTKQLTDIRAIDASPEVQQAVDDYVSTSQDTACD